MNATSLKKISKITEFKTTIQDAKSDQLIAPIIVKNVSINSQLNLDEVNIYMFVEYVWILIENYLS